MKRVLDFLKNAEVYYLATVEGDQPRVRPFGTVNEFEGKLYIQTGKVKPTSHQLAVNPKAEICAFKDGAWIRVDKPIKGIRAGGGEARHGIFLLFFEVRLPCFILPQNRHLLGFFPSLCGGEFVGRIPSRTLENLLAVCVPSHASLELERYDFLSFDLLLDVCHFDRPFDGKKGGS